MSINFCNEDVELPAFNFRVIKEVLKKESILQHLKLEEVNYIFCSDEYLLTINQNFLKHDYFTDVITFDYSEDIKLAGDIYISLERVLDNSVTYEVSFLNELIRVISHGFLHLLKFDDKEDDDIFKMRKKEEELIGKIFSLL